MPREILQHIDDPTDLRKVPPEDLPVLAQEMRDFIIKAVAIKEGHLGASLGVVELTIALHYIFNTPEDRLIWDVGHQAYGHKILTGRQKTFVTNRQLGGISGFPKRSESIYDAFGTGHSSTSISAALGMAIAAKIAGNIERQHIAVIGDASIAGGMAFEALNHAGLTDANLLVILNDNAIGIDPSVGALKQYFTRVKTGSQQRENIFEALNFKYFGPVDGHDLVKLLEILKVMKKVAGPKFLHVITTKGKGLRQAESDQVTYHAPGKFDYRSGELSPKSPKRLPLKFQEVFGHTLIELAEKNEKVFGITPAMPTGSSLKYMMERFPERAIDVGIAEQHAVTLAAGMASEGLIVFCNVYSTFLQRGYDQVIHDVALQNLPVIFCLDRAGLVGEDGPTHHGAFDLAYLNCIPNLMIYAPRNEIGLRNILYTASLGLNGPIAIRYPRGRGTVVNWKTPFQKTAIAKAETLKKGTDLAVLVTGALTQNVLKAAERFGGRVAVYYFGFVKPLDQDALLETFRQYDKLLTVEDGCVIGGFGSSVNAFAAAEKFPGSIFIHGLPDEFVTQGSVDELHKMVKFDITGLTEIISQLLEVTSRD
ncbi:MAG: 1-deoxy-D-xylulose-5-phosphate synthase [Leeuwenhoekiella sp.]